MSKKKDKTVSSTVTDALYIQEIEEKIPEMESELKELDKKQTKLGIYVKECKPFTLPFKYSDTENMPLLDNRYEKNYSGYKKDLYERWRNVGEGRSVITESAEHIVWGISVAVWFILNTIACYKNLNIYAGVGRLCFSFLSFAIYDLIAGFISVWYFVVRPNAINKRQKTKELKQIKFKKATLEKELQINKNLIQQYKIASINPNKQFAQMKAKTAEGLRGIVADTIEMVVPRIPEEYRKQYTKVLEKCNKLLDMSEDNGRIITEVSKIYNIYINDINDILIKSTNGQAVKIATMLNNFESYVDRKIKKFSDVSQMLADNDIDALNAAFEEED